MSAKKSDKTRVEEKDIKEEVVAEETQEVTEDTQDVTEETDKKGKKEKSKAKKSDKKKKEDKEEIVEEKVETPEDKIEALGRTIVEMQDKHLRLAAEYDNFRRRTLKEKSEMLKSAGQNILIDILPVMDNFDRAMSSMENSDDVASVKEGIDLIYTNFKKFISSKGIKEMDAKEKDFDTNEHEAITKIPAPTPELKGKNVDVITKGYKLNDKVIRFAQVVVGE